MFSPQSYLHYKKKKIGFDQEMMDYKGKALKLQGEKENGKWRELN